MTYDTARECANSRAQRTGVKHFIRETAEGYYPVMVTAETAMEAVFSEYLTAYGTEPRLSWDQVIA